MKFSKLVLLLILTGCFNPFAFAQTISLGNAVDAPQLPWTTGGNALWSGQTNVTFDGQDAAVSGVITDGHESWLENTVTGPGSLAFRWKVSSENGYDFLEFYNNGILTAAQFSVKWIGSRVVAVGGNDE